MAHGDAREGTWRGNWWMEWVASTLHTTSEHGVSIIFFGLGFQFCDLPPGSTAARFSKRSYFCRQVPFVSTTRGSPLEARGGTMDEKWWPNGAWDMHPGFFYMPQICDMGPIILLPFRRKACWGFLSPCKNPTASAGFEPTNLGIRDQHATSAPPKPFISSITTADAHTSAASIRLNWRPPPI